MRTLRQLTENGEGCVYILCETDDENAKFKEQAEAEGFMGLDGHTRPTEFPNCKHYGLNDDMTMGYVFGMAWYHFRRLKERKRLMIDYGKYARGEEDYVLPAAEAVGKEGGRV